MFKGVIFDLDGTLLDTIADMSSSVKSGPGAGYPSFHAGINSGRGFRNLWNAVYRRNTVPTRRFPARSKGFGDHDQNYMNETVPYEGIPEVLNHLVEKGVKMGVNSNKRTDYTNNLIRKFFPDIEFVGVFGERAGVPKKPHPQSALEILERMELAANEVIYIGDSGTDIQTGKNAGMATAGVLWGFRTSAELEENGADYILRTPQEIITLF